MARLKIWNETAESWDYVNAPANSALPFGVYSGQTVTVTDGVFGSLTFDSLDAGVELLDRSAPDTPTVLTAGIYQVAVEVSCIDGPLTADGNAVLAVALGSLSNGVATCCELTQKGQALTWGASSTWRCAAGDGFEANIFLNDGASDHGFYIAAACVVKLSS